MRREEAGCHLSQIERLVGIRESGEFPRAAVQVDVAGPEGRQESQPVVHWGKRGIREFLRNASP